MQNRFFHSLAKIISQRAGLVLVAALVVTAISAGLMSQLRLEMHFKNLMPRTHPMVTEFNRVVDDFSTASMIIVAAKGEEDDLKRFADDLAPKLRALTHYVRRVDYMLEKNFFPRHGFMLQKVKDLRNSKDMFDELGLQAWLGGLNDNFEKTYIDENESISTREREDNAVRTLDGIRFWLQTLDLYASTDDSLSPQLAQDAIDRLLIGDPYMISPDKRMLIMLAMPNFSLNEIDKVIAAEDDIDALVHETAAKYSGIETAGTTGTMALTRDETVAIREDAYFTSLIALLLIIGLFVLSFRMWVSPILAGLTLVFGIIWTGGFAALVIGSLNMITSMFAVILIGLGIDFSIHVISGFTENRARGVEPGEALRLTFQKTGSGVILGALSTALAFFTLMIAETAGMSEFGLVAGSGVIFTVLASLTVLPALLIFRERMLSRRSAAQPKPRAADFGFLGGIAERLADKPAPVLTACALFTALMLFSASKITFDYNYLNMEPEGLVSIDLQHEMESAFQVTPDFAVVTAASIEEARELTAAAKGLKMIGMVTSITEYFPSETEQKRRGPLVGEIRANLLAAPSPAKLRAAGLDRFIEELKRLEANIIELGQLAFSSGQDRVDRQVKSIIGDIENKKRGSLIVPLLQKLSQARSKAVERLGVFQNHYAPYLRQTALDMADTSRITMETLPQEVKNRFVSADGGKFLITMYPKRGVWEDILFLERFTLRLQEFDERVTGMPLIFYILIEIIARDGRIAAGLTLLAVLLLLFLHFRSWRFVLAAMTPLVIGAVWMVGLMQLFGLRLTMLNIMSIPLILGIGIDDGVHVLHRYRVEGPGRIKTVFTSTGKAILLTSLTTMLAFGSLVFAAYRGLGSLGAALFIGVGACFLASVTVLPAILGLMEKRAQNKESSMTIREAKAKHQAEIMSIRGVVGVGVGLIDGREGVKVMVAKKTRGHEKKIPSEIEGFPVEIVETGEIQAF